MRVGGVTDLLFPKMGAAGQRLAGIVLESNRRGVKTSNASTKGQNRQLLLLYALRPGPRLQDLIMPDELRWS